MSTGYVPLASNDASQTFLPVEPDRVVGLVELSRSARDEEPMNGSYLVVLSDGQSDVSTRSRTFDLVGPLDPYSRALKAFLGDRFESAPVGEASVDGNPNRSARGWGVAEHAARIVRMQFPNAHFRTCCLVYPLAEAHETFGPKVRIYLYEKGALQVEALLMGEHTTHRA